jgi:hypothetical protein
MPDTFIKPFFKGGVMDWPAIQTEARSGAYWWWPDTSSILVNRFASSAAHLAGCNLIISESFTWLRNHYHTELSHIKAESDKLLTNGINGI